MKHRTWIALAAGLTALSLSAAVRAHSAPAAPATPAKSAETRPPVPPGVPTTAENVYQPTEGEVKLGRQGAAQVEKQYKVVTSGPMHDRLQRVSQEIVQAIQRPEMAEEYRKFYRLPRPGDRSRRVPFEFSFKLVDTTKEVNAFSLAGGPIYVTKGLMEEAASDDELASVLAHECAHVTFHHVEQLVRENRKAQTRQMWGMLAAVLAGVAGGGQAASAASSILAAGQLVQIATMTGYGRRLEHEADRIGILAMVDSRYNPAGMLTFMQKLARNDRLRGNPDYGIFQSHPYSNERVAAIRASLEKSGFQTDSGTLRKVSGSFRIETVAARAGDRSVTELRLNGGLLFTVAAGEGDLTPEERARKIAHQLEELFAGRVTFDDVRQSPDKSVVMVRGVPVIRVLPEDAAVMGGVAAASDQAFRQLVKALWKEKLDL